MNRAVKLAVDFSIDPPTIPRPRYSKENFIPRQQCRYDSAMRLGHFLPQRHNQYGR